MIAAGIIGALVIAAIKLTPDSALPSLPVFERVPSGKMPKHLPSFKILTAVLMAVLSFITAGRDRKRTGDGGSFADCLPPDKRFRPRLCESGVPLFGYLISCSRSLKRSAVKNSLSDISKPSQSFLIVLMLSSRRFSSSML